MKDKISIIIPVYNAEKYICDTLNSIKEQTYKNIEVILVDDGSTDNSKALCKSFLNDKRFILYEQNNSGAPAARNNGLQLSTGSYILFFDADDILKKDAIQNMINIAKLENSDLVISNFSTFCNNQIINNNTQKLNRIKKTPFNLFFISPFPNNKLYKAEVLKINNIKFDDVKIGQDANFFYKSLPFIKKVSVIDQSLSFYRLSENSISRAYNNRILDINRSLDLVENFYIKNNVNNTYYHYLLISRTNHINTQIAKIVNFRNKQEARDCFLILKHEYKKSFKKISPKFNNWTIKSLILHQFYCFKVKLYFLGGMNNA